MVTSKILEGKERKVLMTAQPKHRILIIGDSHVSGHAAVLSDILGHSFNIMQYKIADGKLSYVENGGKLENALFRHERRMENSQSDKDQRNQRKLAVKKMCGKLNLIQMNCRSCLPCPPILMLKVFYTLW